MSPPITGTFMPWVIAMTLGSGAHPRDIDPQAAEPALPAVPAPQEPDSDPQPPTRPPPPRVDPPPAERPVAPARPEGSCLQVKSQCRQLTITGILTSSLGAAAIVVGVVLATRPNQPLHGRPAYERSTRPPGVVAAGMGVGALLTGGLMILAGQRAWRTGVDRSLARNP